MSGPETGPGAGAERDGGAAAGGARERADAAGGAAWEAVPAGLRKRCRAAVEGHRERLLALSHALHADPETAFEEHRAAARVAGVLAAEGFAVRRGVGGLDTALTATYGDGELVVGVCAEYDALPGLGHACGHNVIAAASVGAALALRDVAGDLGVTVKLIGTPAEETGGGKILLLERGVFDDVGFALLIHPSPDELCAPRTLAVTDLEVRYRGRAAHAAFAPHHGVNAADALTVAQVAIGLARQHLEDRQMVHGIVTDGGAVPNVVPDDTRALYYLRAGSYESLEGLERRIRDCLRAGAVATGCAEEVRQVSPAYADLVSDPWLAGAYRSAVTALGRSPVPFAEEAGRLTPASTDMGNVSRALPAIQPSIAVDCGSAVNHQPGFAEVCAGPSGDRAVLDGAVALAWTAASAALDGPARALLLAGVRERAAGRVGGP
ncbi:MULTISPECIES: amidohydrolase [unclassified Streptomyces]|uniref:amidohydrolase n=1 Tax=unclassified Streptomyces TaxID=2593676 RepID=UPI000823E863|nr:amidohydrolase [Streptomyces sp. AmelKG-E11A]SCK61670.1 amidohydrolase [Streptomyces sp. AmelKG-E11A]